MKVNWPFLYKLITMNIRPIMLVVSLTCIGFLAGNFMVGLIIGLLVVALATMLF